MKIMIHARVRLPLLVIADCTALIDMPRASRLCRDAEFMRSIWKRYDAFSIDGDTGSASGAQLFTLFVATLLHLVTPRPSQPDISAQMQGVSVPASYLMSY